MGTTTIEWTDYTFNPWWGCTKVSPGCKNCYAETLDERFSGGKHWGKGAPRRTMSDAYWKAPLRWDRDAAAAGRRPRVFCASMADVFDEEAPDHELARLWILITKTPNLDWLLLTKRPERMRAFFTQAWPNVWLGTSVEDQQRADERIPHLLATPATVRFLSCEPLLGQVDLNAYLHEPKCYESLQFDEEWQCICRDDARPRLHWVIAGGESGGRARPMYLQWIAQIRDDCHWAGSKVAFFLKQLGSQPCDGGRWWPNDWPSETRFVAGKLGDGFDARFARLRDSHGRDMAEWPEDLRIREWPG